MRAILFFLICCTPLRAEPITAISWNTEDGGNDPAIIAKQLLALPKADIYGLQEVSSKNVGRYAAAIRQANGGGSYRHFASWTGLGDRLMISFNEDRLKLHEWREMFNFSGFELNDWNHRSPLIALFEDRDTGQRFYFVNVHLARGKAKLRLDQAIGLRKWVNKADLPVIAVGDWNFDFNFVTGKGNKSFQEFIAGNIWRWAKPKELFDTNWSDRDWDGVGNFPNSILDFAFYARFPRGWRIASKILVRPNDFPDDDKTSDHRPIMVGFETR